MGGWVGGGTGGGGSEIWWGRRGGMGVGGGSVKRAGKEGQGVSQTGGAKARARYRLESW